MSNYQKNKELSKSYNYEPTMTDQSQRDQTDINVVMRNHAISGMVQGPKHPPMYEDFAALPEDLRGFLDMGRELQQHRVNLPEALKHLDDAQLLTADPRELAKIIKDRDTAVERRAKLPAHLQQLPDSSIIALTEAQLTQILTPPQQPQAEPKP